MDQDAPHCRVAGEPSEPAAPIPRPPLRSDPARRALEQHLGTPPRSPRPSSLRAAMHAGGLEAELAALHLCPRPSSSRSRSSEEDDLDYHVASIASSGAAAAASAFGAVGAGGHGRGPLRGNPGARSSADPLVRVSGQSSDRVDSGYSERSSVGSSGSASPRPGIIVAPGSPRTDFSRYRPQYEIGKGSFSTVWKGMDARSQQMVAIKYVRAKPRFREAGAQTELSEAHVTTRLRHPNVVQLLDYRISPRGTETLVFEYLPEGDLFNALDEGEVDESECKQYMVQVADALAFIHRSGFVHNDVKLENMLLAGERVKLCDFGLSGRIGQVRGQKPHGTTPYMAPELLTAAAVEHHTLTPAVDIWSFGIVLYAAIFASIPWEEASERDREFAAFLAHRDYAACEPWSVLHPNVRGCVLSMLSLDPQARPSATEVGAALRGPWVEDPAAPDSPPSRPASPVVSRRMSQSRSNSS